MNFTRAFRAARSGLAHIVATPSRRAALLTFALLLFPPVLSLVSATTVQAGSMPWDSPLQKVEADLQGPVALIIGTILIVVGGLGVAVSHGQGAFKLLWIIVGVGIALNAAKLLTTIAGSGSGFDLPRAFINAHHLIAQVPQWIH